MAAAEADKVRAASKKPQRLFVRPLRLRAGVCFFAPEEASYITRPRGIRGCHWRGQNRKRTFCQSTPHGGIRLPGAVSAAGASFFEEPSSCPPARRLSRTLFHVLPVFLRDAASLSGPPRSMPGVFFPAKYSHRADEICFSAAVFTVIHQKDEEAAHPLR